MLKPTALSTNLPLSIQTSFGSADVKHFCFSFLHQNNYSHAAILHDDSYTFFSLMSKFFTLPVRYGDADLVMVFKEFPFFSDKAGNGTYRRMLLDASNVARVQ
ncbi:hypothetical protein RvY_07418 [Ramazzottius varieornatus]|uniref:Uncharacterized protein n=1 Tax=Ramazzottius varieornatus TaxID=947166 RepID=A0A1D1V743_RAMVA|nr:hypothetical protein RvY_07418 [Ramazzottius varieornatus]